jgi:hypothetical protein
MGSAQALGGSQGAPFYSRYGCCAAIEHVADTGALRRIAQQVFVGFSVWQSRPARQTLLSVDLWACPPGDPSTRMMARLNS